MYLYDEIKYMTSSTRGIGPAFARPTLSEWLGRGWGTIATPLLCVSGAALLLHHRRKIGMYCSAAGLAVWIIWFGYYILAMLIDNFIRYWTNQYTNQFSSALAVSILLFLYAIPVVVLAIGWKKVKWQ